MSSGDRRPVVTGEHNQRRVSQALVVDRPQQSAAGVVQLGDVAVVRGVRRIVMRIELGESLVARDRLVGLMEAGEQEKGTAVVPPCAQPVDRLVGDDLRRVVVGRADLPAVPHEVVGTPVVGQGVVLRAEPVVESMVPRLRLRRLVEGAVEMPFADVARRVARLAEQRGDRHLAGPKMHWRAMGNPITNAEPCRRPTRHQGCARWRAIRVPRIAARQSQALLGELVEVGRAHVGRSVAAQIAIAEVIRKDHHDVRSWLGGEQAIGKGQREP